ncbi:hypothetical protein DPX16_3606, partial [Anabarilius grahami]
LRTQTPQHVRSFLPEQPRNPHRKIPPQSRDPTVHRGAFIIILIIMKGSRAPAPQTKDFHALQRHIRHILHTVTDTRRATITVNPPGEHRDELMTVIHLVILRGARGKTPNATLVRSRGR